MTEQLLGPLPSLNVFGRSPNRFCSQSPGRMLINLIVAPHDSIESTLRRSPTLLVGLRGDGWPVLLDGGQPQVIENELEPRDVDGVVHAATASVPSSAS